MSQPAADVRKEPVPIRMDLSGLLGRTTNDQFLATLALSILNLLRTPGDRFTCAFEDIASYITVFVAKAEGTEYDECLIQFPLSAIANVCASWSVRQPSASDYDTIYMTISNMFLWLQSNGKLGKNSPKTVAGLFNWELLRAECVPSEIKSKVDIASLVMRAALADDGYRVFEAQARRSLRGHDLMLSADTPEGILHRAMMSAAILQDDDREEAYKRAAQAYIAPISREIVPQVHEGAWSFVVSNYFRLSVSGDVVQCSLGFLSKDPQDLSSYLTEIFRSFVLVCLTDHDEADSLVRINLPNGCSRDQVRWLVRYLVPFISDESLATLM